MRKWIEKVKDWPVIRKDCLYEVKVIHIEKDKSQKAIKLTLKFLEGAMVGRIIEVCLPLPIRPAGITCDYFKACGFDISINRDIEPHQTNECSLMASFTESATSESYEIASFEPIRGDHNESN